MKKNKTLYHIEHDMESYFILAYNIIDALSVFIEKTPYFNIDEGGIIINSVCSEYQIINNENVNSFITNINNKNK